MFFIIMYFRSFLWVLKCSFSLVTFLHAGHLEMVRFLLEAGADQEHKTDEMHTALMEACMVRDIRLEQSGLWALFSSQRWRK